MDTKDKTAPAGVVEEELSAEEKAVHAEEAKRLAELKARIDHATPDEALPQVQSDQSL